MALEQLSHERWTSQLSCQNLMFACASGPAPVVRLFQRFAIKETQGEDARVLLLKLGVKLEISSPQGGRKEKKQLFENRTVFWKALRHVQI